MRRKNGGFIGPLSSLAQTSSGIFSLEDYQQANVARTMEYLVVAGGGGTSADGRIAYAGYGGGGGGAGGYRVGNISMVPGTYSVIIGAGGSNTGSNGSNSSFGTIQATGGGCGSSSDESVAATAGGSGGGGGGGQVNGAAGNLGGYSPVEGYAGGTRSAPYSYGCGGGGATGAGVDSTNGGDGKYNSISGTNTYYARGGYGGQRGDRDNGPANTGIGGSGGIAQVYNGTNGGSGIVVIKYLGTQKATGGTVTSSNGYTIHSFTSSGSFIVG